MKRTLSFILVLSMLVSCFLMPRVSAAGADDTPKSQQDWNRIYNPEFSMTGGKPQNFTTNKISGYTAVCEAGEITVTANQDNTAAGQIRIPFDALGQGKYYVEMEYKTQLNQEDPVGTTGDVTVNLGGYSSIERVYLCQNQLKFWKVGKVAAYEAGQESQWHRFGFEIDLTQEKFSNSDQLIKFYMDGSVLFDGASFPPGYASDRLNRNSMIFDFNAEDFKNGESLSVRNFEIWQYAPQVGPTADEKLAADMEALTWDSIKKDNAAENNVTGGLNLVKTAGTNGTAVEWTAEPSGIIDAGTGAVTRPADEDKTVTLTAAGTLEGASQPQEKSFTLTVKKAEGSGEETLPAGRVLDGNWTALTEESKTFDNAETGITFSDPSFKTEFQNGAFTITCITPKATYPGWNFKKTYTEGKYYLELITKHNVSGGDPVRDLIGTAGADSKAQPLNLVRKPGGIGATKGAGWAADLKIEPAATQWYNLGVEIDLDAPKYQLYINGQPDAVNGAMDFKSTENVKLGKWVLYLKTAFLKDESISFADFKMWKYEEAAPELTDAEKLAADKEKLTWLVIKGDNTDRENVTSKLNLPEVIGEYETRVAWSSNHAAVSEDGTVTRPADEAANVTLTAVLTQGEATETVYFDLIVPKQAEDPGPEADETPKYREGWKLVNTVHLDEAHQDDYTLTIKNGDAFQTSYDEEGRLKITVTKTGVGDGFSDTLKIPLKGGEALTSGRYYGELVYKTHFTSGEMFRNYLGTSSSYAFYNQMKKGPVGPKVTYNGAQTWPIDLPREDDVWERLGFEFDLQTQILRFYVNGKEYFPKADPNKPMTFHNPLDPNNSYLKEFLWATRNGAALNDYAAFEKMELWQLDDSQFWEDAGSLTWDTIKGANSLAAEVTEPLVLIKSIPHETGEATAISWRSSNPEAVNPETGAVTASAIAANKVTLTAIMTQEKYGLRTEKSFVLTVPRKDAEKFVVIEEQAFDQPDSAAAFVKNGDGKLEVSGGALVLAPKEEGKLSASAALGAEGLEISGEWVQFDTVLTPSGAGVLASAELMELSGNTVIAASLNNGGWSISNSGGAALTFAGGAGGRLSLLLNTAAQTADVYLDGVKQGQVRIAGSAVSSVRFSAEYTGALRVEELGLSIYSEDPDSVRIAVDPQALSSKDLSDEAPDHITRNLKLNSVIRGLTGSDIAWRSSRPEIISENGSVNRPAEDTPVTLTAVFTSGAETAEKEFTVLVLGTKNEDLAYGAAVTASSAQTGYEAANLTDGRDGTGWLAEAEDEAPSVTVTLPAVRKISVITLRENGAAVREYSLELSSDGKEWTTVYTGTTIGAEKEIVIHSTEARYIRYTVTKKEQGATGLDAFEVRYRMSDQERVDADLAALKLERSPDGGRFILPAEGENGSAIAWRSSHPSVVDPATGVITPGGQTVWVNLTAVVSYGNASGEKRYSEKIDGAGAGGGGGGGSRPSHSGGGSGISLGGSTILGNNGSGTPEPDGPKQPSGTATFADVPEESWSYPYVYQVQQAGIISGDGSGNFYPQAHITREEFVKMIVLALDLETAAAGESSFHDVKADDWFAPYVQAAYEAGIVKGVTETDFGVGGFITRQDMAVMTDRALELAGRRLEDGDYTVFSDADEISGYARESVGRLNAAKILEGSGGRFAPADPLTREQAAKVIALIMN